MRNQVRHHEHSRMGRGVHQGKRNLWGNDGDERHFREWLIADGLGVRFRRRTAPCRGLSRKQWGLYTFPQWSGRLNTLAISGKAAVRAQGRSLANNPSRSCENIRGATLEAAHKPTIWVQRQGLNSIPSSGTREEWVSRSRQLCWCLSHERSTVALEASILNSETWSAVPCIRNKLFDARVCYSLAILSGWGARSHPGRCGSKKPGQIKRIQPNSPIHEEGTEYASTHASKLMGIIWLFA